MRRPSPTTIVAALAVVSLFGCVSPEEMRRQDEAQCASYGFAPGTPDFALCLQREALARRGNGGGVTLGLGFSGGF